jgi:hypothetical protein
MTFRTSVELLSTESLLNFLLIIGVIAHPITEFDFLDLLLRIRHAGR